MKIHGDQLKELRKAHGMTMAEVAEKLGVTEGTISRYENGQIKRVSPSVITGYSKLFHVPATDLYENPETEWLAAFSGGGMYDSRVRGFIEYLEEQAAKESEMCELTRKEIDVIDAYRSADERTRRLVDYALGIASLEDSDG